MNPGEQARQMEEPSALEAFAYAPGAQVGASLSEAPSGQTGAGGEWAVSQLGMEWGDGEMVRW